MANGNPDPLEPIGGDLVRWLTRTAENGQMNANTAGGLKGACKEVLGAAFPDDWEGVNLTSLDVEDTVKRFERLRSAKFSPTSLSVYKSRFKNSVSMYLTFLENPSAWRYTPERPAALRKPRTPRERAPAASTAKPAAPTGGSQIETLTYPFPLRPGFSISLTLPTDLSSKEVERLSAYLSALAVDEMKALPVGRGMREVS